MSEDANTLRCKRTNDQQEHAEMTTKFFVWQKRRRDTSKRARRTTATSTRTKQQGNTIRARHIASIVAVLNRTPSASDICEKIASSDTKPSARQQRRRRTTTAVVAPITTGKRTFDVASNAHTTTMPTRHAAHENQPS